jgi:hypothetical protein
MRKSPTAVRSSLGFGKRRVDSSSVGKTSFQDGAVRDRSSKERLVAVQRVTVVVCIANGKTIHSSIDAGRGCVSCVVALIIAELVGMMATRLRILKEGRDIAVFGRHGHADGWA